MGLDFLLIMAISGGVLGFCTGSIHDSIMDKRLHDSIQAKRRLHA